MTHTMSACMTRPFLSPDLEARVTDFCSVSHEEFLREVSTRYCVMCRRLLVEWWNKWKEEGVEKMMVEFPEFQMRSEEGKGKAKKSIDSMTFSQCTPENFGTVLWRAYDLCYFLEHDNFEADPKNFVSGDFLPHVCVGSCQALKKKKQLSCHLHKSRIRTTVLMEYLRYLKARQSTLCLSIGNFTKEIEKVMRKTYCFDCLKDLRRPCRSVAAEINALRSRKELRRCLGVPPPPRLPQLEEGETPEVSWWGKQEAQGKGEGPSSSSSSEEVRKEFGGLEGEGENPAGQQQRQETEETSEASVDVPATAEAEESGEEEEEEEKGGSDPPSSNDTPREERERKREEDRDLPGTAGTEERVGGEPSSSSSCCDHGEGGEAPSVGADENSESGGEGRGTPEETAALEAVGAKDAGGQKDGNASASSSSSCSPKEKGNECVTSCEARCTNDPNVCGVAWLRLLLDVGASAAEPPGSASLFFRIDPLLALLQAEADNAAKQQKGKDKDKDKDKAFCRAPSLEVLKEVCGTLLRPFIESLCRGEMTDVQRRLHGPHIVASLMRKKAETLAASKTLDELLGLKGSGTSGGGDLLEDDSWVDAMEEEENRGQGNGKAKGKQKQKEKKDKGKGKKKPAVESNPNASTSAKGSSSNGVVSSAAGGPTPSTLLPTEECEQMPSGTDSSAPSRPPPGQVRLDFLYPRAFFRYTATKFFTRALGAWEFFDPFLFFAALERIAGAGTGKGGAGHPSIHWGVAGCTHAKCSTTLGSSFGLCIWCCLGGRVPPTGPQKLSNETWRIAKELRDKETDGGAEEGENTEKEPPVYSPVVKYSSLSNLDEEDDASTHAVSRETWLNSMSPTEAPKEAEGGKTEEGKEKTRREERDGTPTTEDGARSSIERGGENENGRWKEGEAAENGGFSVPSLSRDLHLPPPLEDACVDEMRRSNGEEGGDYRESSSCRSPTSSGDGSRSPQLSLSPTSLFAVESAAFLAELSELEKCQETLRIGGGEGGEMNDFYQKMRKGGGGFGGKKEKGGEDSDTDIDMDELDLDEIRRVKRCIESMRETMRYHSLM